MPAYVIAPSGHRIGETTDAVICDLGALGVANRQSDVPVRAKFVSDRVLCVDDEPRWIISIIRQDAETVFLVDGSTRSIGNRERRVALANASTLLQQLAASLRPLAAESDAPEAVTEALQQLSDWIRDELESATGG